MPSEPIEPLMGRDHPVYFLSMSRWSKYDMIHRMSDLKTASTASGEMETKTESFLERTRREAANEVLKAKGALSKAIQLRAEANTDVLRLRGEVKDAERVLASLTPRHKK